MNSVSISGNITQGIEVVSRPMEADVGLKSFESSFHLSVTANTINYEDTKVILYAFNSKSIPYHPNTTNNYSFLKPQWRFTTEDGELISEYASVDFHTELLSGGEVVGAVGDLKFYYIDDLPSDLGIPVMLMATLDTETFFDKDLLDDDLQVLGGYNSEMTVIMPFYVMPLLPRFLHFSENGSKGINDLQWTGLDINAYATLRGIPERSRTPDLEFPTRENCPVLFSQPLYDTSVTCWIHPLSSTDTSETFYFKKFEMEGSNVYGGWAETHFTPNEKCDSAEIIGYSEISYDPTVISASRIQTTSLWVSNVTSNQLCKIQSLIIDPTTPIMRDLLASKTDLMHFNNSGSTHSVNVYTPSAYEFSPVSANEMELSAYSGVYSFAVDTLNQCVWYADYELDTITKSSLDGTPIKTYDLQKNWILSGGDSPYLSEDNTEYTWFGPNSICVDSQGTLYASLYNSVSCLKIDGDDMVFFTPSASELSGGAIPPLSGIASEQDLLRPVKVFTDEENGLFVIYGNNLRSRISHYSYSELSGDGGPLACTWQGIASGMVPVDAVYIKSPTPTVVVSFRGIPAGVWAIPHNSGGFGGWRLLTYCDNPGHMTLDDSGAVWFGYSNINIAKVADITISGQYITDLHEYTIPTSMSGEDIIGGIAFDGSKRINVIDSYANKIYRWAYNTAEVTDSGIEIIQIEKNNFRPVLSGDNIEFVELQQPSLMAFGDWTGEVNRYLYSSESGSTPTTADTTLIVSGSSTPFRVKTFTPKYGLRKFNGSWDMKSQIKSYIFPEYQKQFVSLWDDLIGTIVGDGTDGFKAMGSQIYEKIANFVLNHSSLDYSNLEEIYSNFESIGTDYESYTLNYPAELKHWMDILSISLDKLRGSEYKCNRNFIAPRYQNVEACEICGNVHPTNLGEKLSNDYKMVVGTPIVIEDTYKSTRRYDIFYPHVGGPLSKLEEYGFRAPFSNEYNVYSFVDTPTGSFVNKQGEGIINWEDPYNEFDIKSIGREDWSVDGGMMDQILSQVLFRNTGDGKSGTYTEATVAPSNWNVISNFSQEDIIPINSEYIFTFDSHVAHLETLYTICTDMVFPIYTALDTLDLSKEITNEIYPLDIDTISIDKYLKVPISGVDYFIPLYSPIRSEEFITCPIYGTGGIYSTFSVVTSNDVLTAAGHLGINTIDGQRFIPIYIK